MTTKPIGQPIPPKPRPKDASTYFELSQQNAEAEVGGRFAPARPYVIGSGGVPPFPASVWEADIGNKEAPLGEDISTVEQMLTVSHGGAALIIPAADDEAVAPAEPADDGEDRA